MEGQNKSWHAAVYIIFDIVNYKSMQWYDDSEEFSKERKLRNGLEKVA